MMPTVHACHTAICPKCRVEMGLGVVSILLVAAVADDQDDDHSACDLRPELFLFSCIFLAPSLTSHIEE